MALAPDCLEKSLGTACPQGLSSFSPTSYTLHQSQASADSGSQFPRQNLGWYLPLCSA